MSRQNKVNPGMYTQRGRLTQDDAARELKRQRVIGSQHTWQPVQRDQMPVFTAEPVADDAAEDTDTAARRTVAEKKPAKAKAAKTAKPASPSAKASKSKPSPRRARKSAARTPVKAAKKATTAARRVKAKTAKPAVSARPKAKAKHRRG